MLTALEKKIIAAIQDDIAVVEQPYRALAEALGIPEGELLETLQRFKDEGIIRRFGATLRHQNSGFTANAMVAWQVPAERVDAVGLKMAAFAEVSHCYHRNPKPTWPYNLYTMIHARNEAQCRQTARRMSDATGGLAYRLLFSRRELKKTSMTYFPAPGQAE